ncbi:MAG: radical SAM protein, partial [Calditrichales bacterium]
MKEMPLLNELSLRGLLAALTFRRVKNLLLTGSSFLASLVLKRPVAWGNPAIVTVEPTNICNLHCPLCTTGAGDMHRPSGKMTLETFQQLITLLGPDIFFLLIYHQGEPYINPHFFSFIKLAKQQNIYVTTSTNGHYFTDDNIRQTIESGLDSMIISVDGANQDSYEKYRIGGQLEKVLDGSARLIAERNRLGKRYPRVSIQFLVMKHNNREIGEVKKIAARIGADRFLVKNIEVHSVEEAKVWLPDDPLLSRYHFDGKSIVVNGNAKKSCPRPWMSTLVNWDGSLVPCCFDKNSD